MKTDFILSKTQVLAYRPQCIGQHGHNVRESFMFWGCVTYSGGTNVLKCELKEVHLNLIKVYGQSLQNILEIPHLYSKMKSSLSWFTTINNSLEKGK